MSALRDVDTRENLRRGESMAKHTSWRLGGAADYYFRPASRTELCDFLHELDETTPVHWIGFGSNVLVREGGIRGVVIAATAALANVHRLPDGLVEAEAGVPCTVLARRCARWNLGSAEFFAGIPGSIGGALRMNAGAFGGETWDSVVEVDTVDRRGRMRMRTPDEFEVSYREVSGPVGEWCIAARFQFEPAAEDSMERVRLLMQERKQKQPLGLPSCGSVFRNPRGDHAARLIDAAGLKGLRVGGAQVSEKHANFIINTGAATAADVERLIEQVRDAVEKIHGVRLQLEVHIIGEPAAAEETG
jgi:UDP-N-acetylmuramate dehydrogenase